MVIERRNIRPDLATPGRGAQSNLTGRFERFGRENFDDGWQIEEERRVVRTEFSEERPRRALTKNSSPDIPFDRSINMYRGCEHGCAYCFARPSHAFLGLSPGLDFETKIIVKPGIAAVLRREMSRPGYKVAPIALGTNTDPYQPAETRYRLTPDILVAADQFNHPITVVTKGRQILRDIDLLAGLAERNLVHVGISVTTLDRFLCRRLEPRAPAPAHRLDVIAQLSARGIPVRVMVAPVIPALTDHEMENIIEAAAGVGAGAAGWIMLRLPQEVSPLFRDWLAEHVPDRAQRILARVAEMRGGRDYDPTFGSRMKGEGHYAELIEHRFKIAVRRLGLVTELPPLATDKFMVPERGSQLSLF